MSKKTKDSSFGHSIGGGSGAAPIDTTSIGEGRSNAKGARVFGNQPRPEYGTQGSKLGVPAATPPALPK